MTYIVRDLDNGVDTEIRHDGKHFLLRSEAHGTAGKVCQAAGVALPRTVRAAAKGSRP